MFGRGSVRAGVVFASSVVFSSALAFGQTLPQVPGLVLDWPSLPECPSKEQVTLGVQRALGSAAPRTQSIYAHVAVERQSKWVLRLQTESTGGQGERQIEGDSCAQVAEALAVILAMLIDQEAAKATSAGAESNVVNQRPQETGAAVAYAPPPYATVATVATAATVATVQLGPGAIVLKARGAPSDARLGVAVGAVLSLGVERASRLGFSFAVDRAQGWFRWFVYANYFPGHDVGLASNPRRGAHVSEGSVGASLGVRALRGPFEIVPRVGLLGFAVRARGFGVNLQPLSETVYWSSLTFGNVISADLGRSFGAQLALDLTVPFSRPAARLDPGGDVLRPSQIGAQAYLAGVCRF